MYVLKRKPGESFVIDDRVTVTVLGMTSTTVKIGVEAADDVSVRRVETDNQTEEPAEAGETLEEK